MKYEAIVFDLDGTAIINAQDVLPSERLIKTIKAAGVSFKLCAATGRPISSAKKILDTLGLVDPCVISAGTEIVDPRTGEMLWECDIEPDDVQRVLEICGPYPYELLIRNELVGKGTTAKERRVTEPVNVMYLMQCSEADATKILETLASVPTISVSGVTSWTGKDIDIHITHKEATKEHAIAKLLEMIGVAKDKVIGVGDANNDVHLFKSIGLKVAMGNATDLLKSQADVVCEAVEDDGLAKIIEEMLISQQS